ncbi:MAG: LD-carboxypeptidase [Bacteroidales bacterium]|nr:LD-carboxypeptidase [Bacteroidales bacterium]
MITPPFLKSGDKIAIIATARKVSPSEMDVAINTFHSWGLQVITGPHLFGSTDQYSGTDEERTSDLQMMLDDKEIKAIICARGGYGTVRIIDSLDFSTFEQYPKWIVGYSDITVLHSHIQTQFGIETLHATMPINFPDEGTEAAVESLRKALFGETLEYNIGSHPLNNTGNVSGVLTGGNLSILYSLTGTPSDIQTQDKILFIEDLDEYLYHIDRMMMNLKRSGKISGIKGLIVGGLTKMNDNTVPFGKQAEQIIAEYAEDTGIPLCFNFPAGHIADNRALILGREVQLNITPNDVSVQFLPSGETAKKGSIFRKILKPAIFFLGFFAFIYLILYLIRLFLK